MTQNVTTLEKMVTMVTFLFRVIQRGPEFFVSYIKLQYEFVEAGSGRVMFNYRPNTLC